MKAISVVAAFIMFAGAASAQTLDDLKNDGKNPDNVLTYGMGYHLNRYSPLKQIDKTNVKRLVPVWNLSLDNQWGEQAQPLVYEGVMYVTDAKATVAAIREEEALASGPHSVAEIDKWENAHFSEHKIHREVIYRKRLYEDALRREFFGF